MSAARRTAYADNTSEPHFKQWAKHPTGICGEPGCGRKHFTHDMCNMHWLRHRRKIEEDIPEDDDPLRPVPLYREDKRWRPEWKPEKPKRLRTMRKHVKAVSEKASAVWSTTASNRAAGVIARRRFAISSIVERLGETFELVNRGPSATVLASAEDQEQFSVPTADWDTLTKAEWVAAPAGSKTFNPTELGKEQLAKFSNGTN